jgi:hypothetical protein
MSTYGPQFDALSAMVRSEGRCRRCRRAFHPSKLDAHHAIPRRVGGPDTYGNLVPLCDECHPSVERETQAAVRLLTRPQAQVRRSQTAAIYGLLGQQPPPPGLASYGLLNPPPAPPSPQVYGLLNPPPAPPSPQVYGLLNPVPR